MSGSGAGALLKRLLPTGAAVVLAALGVLVIADRLGRSGTPPPVVPPPLSIEASAAPADAGVAPDAPSP